MKMTHSSLALKKPARYKNSRNHANHVYQQHRSQSITGIFNVYRTKINGNYIKSAFGAALKNTAKSSRHRIGSKSIHRINQKAA